MASVYVRGFMFECLRADHTSGMRNVVVFFPLLDEKVICELLQTPSRVQGSTLVSSYVAYEHWTAMSFYFSVLRSCKRLGQYVHSPRVDSNPVTFHWVLRTNNPSTEFWM